MITDLKMENSYGILIKSYGILIGGFYWDFDPFGFLVSENRPAKSDGWLKQGRKGAPL